MTFLLNLVSFLPLVGAVVAVILLLLFAGPALKVCDLIPGRLWLFGVILLVGALGSALLHIQALTSERDAARTEATAAKSDLGALQGAVKMMKKQAADELAALKAERDAKQEQLNAAFKAQEIKDANSQATVDRYSRQLASVRLRDPYAKAARCGGSSGGAAGSTAAAPDNRAADPADAPGVLSERTSEDLRRLQRTADQINLAFASCKGYAQKVISAMPAPAAQ